MVASIVKTIELRALTEKADITRKLSILDSKPSADYIVIDAMAVLAIWWT